MGQRHQAFLIARIRPHGGSGAKYRCIAAAHHQWCYGSLPLQAARRFLTLVREPDNAAIVRYEINALDGRYGRHRQDPEIPDVPCRYAGELLTSAFSCDLEEAYVSNSWLLSASMGSTGGGRFSAL
jgi:hypothetical protein